MRRQTSGSATAGRGIRWTWSLLAERPGSFASFVWARSRRVGVFPVGDSVPDRRVSVLPGAGAFELTGQAVEQAFVAETRRDLDTDRKAFRCPVEGK